MRIMPARQLPYNVNGHELFFDGVSIPAIVIRRFP